eukprot:Opistho-1_new@29346
MSSPKMGTRGMVLDGGKDGVVLQHPPVSVRTQSAQWRALLFRAARDGDVASVRACLMNGAAREINARDSTGETPLHVAAFRGYLTVVQVLVEAGADVHSQDVKGATPLHAAVNGCDMQVFTYLLSCGANIDAQDFRHRTPLHYAAEWGDSHVVRFLLNCGANPQVRDVTSRLPKDMTRRQDIRALLSQPQMDLLEASAQRKMAFRVLDDLLREEEQNLVRREREMQAQRAVRLQRRLDYETRVARDREQALRTRCEVEAYVLQERRAMAESVAAVKRRAQAEAQERQRKARQEQHEAQLRRLTGELERTWRQLEVAVLKVPRVNSASRRHIVVGATTFAGIEGWDPNGGLNGIGQLPSNSGSPDGLIGSSYGYRPPDRGPPPLGGMYGSSWLPGGPRPQTVIPHSTFTPKPRDDKSRGDASRARSAAAVLERSGARGGQGGDSDSSSDDEGRPFGHLGLRPRSSRERDKPSSMLEPPAPPAGGPGSPADAPAQPIEAAVQPAGAADATPSTVGVAAIDEKASVPSDAGASVADLSAAASANVAGSTSNLSASSANLADTNGSSANLASTVGASDSNLSALEEEPKIDAEKIFGKPITEGAVVVIHRTSSRPR